MKKTSKTTSTQQPKKSMSFIDVLNSEYRSIVESIEHHINNPNDRTYVESLAKELYEKTGYEYGIDDRW